MFRTENDEVMKSFLERTFYARWKNPVGKHLQNFSGIEFMLNARCNLACKYCYLARFGDQLFPEELNDEETTLRNLDTLIRWIKENDFYPKLELFTGETFTQPIAFKILDLIIDELGDPNWDKEYLIRSVAKKQRKVRVVNASSFQVGQLVHIRNHKQFEVNVIASIEGNAIIMKNPVSEDKDIHEGYKVSDKSYVCDIERVIVIPTNFTFLLSDVLTEKVEDLLQRAKDSNIRISLSASFDGKYCEANRPFKRNVAYSEVSPARVWSWKYKGLTDPRDDAYYDKAFAFAKKWNFGFHPMVYSEHVEDWEKNFLWFQENFEKIGHPWMYLYLLEIRNVEWSDKQLQDYMKFIKFLWRWSYQKCGHNIERLFHFLFNNKGFNILSGVLSSTGRGIGCSIQATLFVRLGDLTIMPCHRTGYEHFKYGQFKVESGIQKIKGYKLKAGKRIKGYTKDSGDRIIGVEAENVDLMMCIYSMDSANWPYCESCLINPLCNKGCLGSQYEVTGDLFTPIPTVCRMYHAKVRATVEVLTELKIFDTVLDRISSDTRKEKKEALLAFRTMLQEVNRSE